MVLRVVRHSDVVGKITHSWPSFHVAGTTSIWILAAIECRLLAPAASRSVFQHSSPRVGSGLLVVADAVGTSTWRESVDALWNASVDDTAPTYFLTTHGKTSLCKFEPNVDDM
jgi:hypothetical protein